MVEMVGVSKGLGDFYMKDISFFLPGGYICGVAGENGSGKTTLLNLLMGLYRADTGTIKIEQKSYAAEEKQIHDLLGVVLNEDLMFSGFSLEKNGDYFGKYYSGYEKEKYLSCLFEFELEKEQKFGRLSKGEKLKCQFAFALACNPVVLILDEPTANFDPKFREKFLRYLREFVADGKRNVLLATHLMEELDCIADYLIYLENGQLIFEGDIEKFREEYRIVAGENYKINLLGKDIIISSEQKKYGTKALVRHSCYNDYDKELSVAVPTLEEFMYFLNRRKRGEKLC